jgi:glyoxalase-like protein
VLTSIDHVVIAVPDLDEASAALERAVGLRSSEGGTHPALGTANRIVWFGDSYAELVAVVDEGLATSSWLGSATIAARATGGAFVTWAIRTDGLDADVRSARASGARFGDPAAGERTRPDGRSVRWRLALPDRIGPTELPFLIERDETSAEWTPADRAARSIEPQPLGNPLRLDVLELPTPDVPGSILRWLRTYGVRFRPSLAGGGARDANLGRQLVRLRPAGPGVLPVLRLAAPMGDGRSVEVLGCRWTVRPSG